MNRFRASALSALLLWIITISMLITAGCSAGDPSAPASTPVETHDAECATHFLMGYYRCLVDIDGSIEALPDRAGMIHANVTPFLQPPACYDCISFQVLEFKPAIGMLLVAVTLKNPTPLTGFDVRGIFISDLDPPHDILNRDGYTELWDNGGPVSRNPFIWFDNDNPFDGGSSKTEIFYIKMPVPPSFSFTYAVDASWPGHCPEPYSLRGYIGPAVDGTEDTEIVMFVEDWQDNITSVTADTTELTGSLTELTYDVMSDTWLAEDIGNGMGLPDGEYSMWIWAESPNAQDVKIYQKLYYHVGTQDILAGGWPLERCGIDGRGNSSFNGPADGELKWKHQFTGYEWSEEYSYTPIGDNSGNIYVSLPDKLVAVDIYGDEAWSFPITNAIRTFTPFLRGDDVIVWPVNRTLGGYDLGFLYFIDENGDAESCPGMLPGPGNACATPTPDGNIVIPIGSGIHACNADGYGIWEYIPGTGEFTIPHAAVVNQNYIVFVSNRNGPDTEIICLYSDGNIAWSSPLNGVPIAQPMYDASGGVFAPSSMWDFSQFDKFGIQARDLGTGDNYWPNTWSNYKCLTDYALAEFDSEVIYGSPSGDYICYSVDASDGTALHNFQTFGVLQDHVSAPSVDASGQVYVGGETFVAGKYYSTFVCLDGDLDLIWETQEEGGGFVGSPIIALDGYVHCIGLAGDNTVQLYCYGEK